MSEQPTPAGANPAPSPGHSSASLARASALMASGTFVSRILGMVRALLLAGAIGLLSPAGNAWQTANTLPNTIYILLAGGVLNVVLVPALTRAMAMSPDKGRDFTDRLITLAMVGLVVITVVFTAGGALLTQFYALSWSGDQLALAVTFAYLCLPQIFFYGVYTLLGQILNSREKWGWYMWAPVLNNVVTIAGITVFMARYPEARTLSPGEWTGEMIWLLAGTATLGVIVQAGSLLWPVWRSGFRYRPRWGFRGVGLGAASRMALWMLAIIGVSQAGMWLTSNVLNRASDLDSSAGGRIVYDNAFLIYILPHSLIATSLITAMFTQMSKSAQEQDLTGLGTQFRHGLRLLGVAMVPISIGLLILAPAISAILFFNNTPEETLATAWVTMAMVVGLAPYAVYILSSRIFHAFQDGRTPFKMQVVITCVSVVGILLAALVPPAQTAVGIGLAQTLGQGTAAVLGIFWVRRRLGHVPLGDVVRGYRRIVVATLVGAAVLLAIVLGSKALFEGRVEALVSVLVGGPVFFAVYGLVAHRLGVAELAEAVGPLLRRLRLGGGQGGGPADPPGSGSTAHPEVGPTDRSEPEPSPRTDEPSPRADEEGLRHAEHGSSSPTSPGPTIGLAPTEHTQHQEVWGMALEPGTMLGRRYALEELLAQRGDVLEYWSALDATLERLVAVTVLPSTGDRAILAHAVLDGARRTAGVDDPRLVRVLDVGEENGYCWIVEEGLPDAESLASLTSSGEQLPAEEARRVVGEAAVGLESARRRGLHHLYLNPHSVLRTRDGSIKVSGVGVTAAIEQTDDIGAREASLIDTADLASLLYTGLTGRWPGDEIEGLPAARRLADSSLPAPSEVVGGVPGDLDALCRAMLGLDYDPADGPQTPGELARQLSPWSPDPVVGPSGRQPAAVPTQGATETSEGPETTAAAGAGSAEAEAGDTGAEDAVTDDTGADAAPYFRTGGDGPGEGGYRAGGTAYVPEDEDTDLAERYAQTPDRGLPPGVRNRDTGRGQTWVVLLLIAALIAVAAVAAYNVISNTLDGTGTADQGRPLPTSAAPTETATDDEAETTQAPADEEETTQEPEPGAAIEFVDAVDFDSTGGDEKPELTANAIDDDPDTAWNTYTYLASNWGGLKSGVGLALDMGETTPVSEVTVEFPEGDYGATVYVGDEPTNSGTEIGSSDDASDTWTVSADEPVEGRYVIVYFDRAWAGPNGEIVRVSEVTARQ